jgi:hypothetical protein
VNLVCGQRWCDRTGPLSAPVPVVGLGETSTAHFPIVTQVAEAWTTIFARDGRQRGY